MDAFFHQLQVVHHGAAAPLATDSQFLERMALAEEGLHLLVDEPDAELEAQFWYAVGLLAARAYAAAPVLGEMSGDQVLLEQMAAWVGFRVWVARGEPERA